jgi:hypothetical protein
MKTKLDALEQALKLTARDEPKRDDEFSAAEFADKANMHAEGARKLLHRAVKEGKLTIRKTSKCHYYSIAK